MSVVPPRGTTVRVCRSVWTSIPFGKKFENSAKRSPISKREKMTTNVDLGHLYLKNRLTNPFRSVHKNQRLSFVIAVAVRTGRRSRCDIWCALDHLATSLAEVQQVVCAVIDMSSISTTLADLEKRQVLLGTNITDLRAKNIEYDDRFNTIGPIIKRMIGTPGSTPLSTAMPVGDLERRILKLESNDSNKIVQQLCERVSSLELHGPQ